MLLVGQMASAVVAVAAIARLIVMLRRARFAAFVAIDIARRALDHDEMGVDVAADLGLDAEEADEERDWICQQRGRLETIRPLVGLPPRPPRWAGDLPEASP